MRQVRTARRHEIPQRPPLRLSVGQHAHAGERDGTWPEFVFVTAEHGSGWVPARRPSSDSGPVVVTTSYDTTELATRAGDVLRFWRRTCRAAGSGGADTTARRG